MKKEHIVSYEELRWEELTEQDRTLLEAAIEATDTSHSPYSHFRVGAALRLASGETVKGSNQENIAYPSGLCAERTAMFAAATQHPGEAFDTLAVVARNPEGALCGASPCGACRQVMAEYETKQQRKMRVLVFFSKGKILIFDSVERLLPFCFEM
ncbi:MAG: cytidine deaminase [Bacteroidales bacterium]|nr:cytidine deaminase [Bacteroidales bacterium]